MSPDSGLLTGNPGAVGFSPGTRRKSVQGETWLWDADYGDRNPPLPARGPIPELAVPVVAPALDLAAGEECTGEAVFAATWVASVMFETATGVEWLLVVPFPSCPVLFGPQHSILPPERSAQGEPPIEIWMAFVMPGT